MTKQNKRKKKTTNRIEQTRLEKKFSVSRVRAWGSVHSDGGDLHRGVFEAGILISSTLIAPHHYGKRRDLELVDGVVRDAAPALIDKREYLLLQA